MLACCFKIAAWPLCKYKNNFNSSCLWKPINAVDWIGIFCSWKHLEVIEEIRSHHWNVILQMVLQRTINTEGAKSLATKKQQNE